MTTFPIKTVVTVQARYLKVEAGVRYWEDAKINGVQDEDGTLTPLRSGDCWAPTIDLSTGVIENWPAETTAEVHFKVCDDGRYALLDEDRKMLVSIDSYVPEIMCPGGNGYGDYIIMSIGEDGKIAGWRVVLDEFGEDGE